MTQSSRHCWRKPLPHTSALIQRYFGCVLGVQQTTRGFHTLSKLIWCGSWGCNLGQSLSNHGPHVFYRRKIRRASRPGKKREASMACPEAHKTQKGGVGLK
ncbi:hypothetical protein TNCV_1358841 [Trichonephila clavipes]|uniref:Uncharacterized protein n=1 Tax=Trichonephila clavipes TaxID=2585209 RepID=A0A8X6VJP5_TRICX|nr:hypothetical protein TNCV_1358841 [Trichonephila clavipes]